MSQELNEAERELATWCATRVNMTPDGLTRLVWMTAWNCRATVPAAQQAIRMTPELRAELVAWGRSPEGDEDADEALLAVLNAGAAAQQAGWVSVPITTLSNWAQQWTDSNDACYAEFNSHDDPGLVDLRRMIAAAPSAPVEAAICDGPCKNDPDNPCPGCPYGKNWDGDDEPAEAASVRDAQEQTALYFERNGGHWLGSEVAAAIRALQGKPEAAKGGGPC